MEIPFIIKKTIDSRRSARSYKMINIHQEVMNSIRNFGEVMTPPFEHDIEIIFFKSEPTNKLYMTMKSPPDNVAFLAETDVISISKVGFIGELLILFAHSKGVSTCWYGHYKLSELERLMPHLQSKEQLKESNMGFGYSKGITTGRRAICISPLGYHNKKGLRILDRITKKTASFKRKEIIELLEEPNEYNKLSADIIYALDLGRKAPSAGNSQMWRFSFEDNYRTIIISMPIGYKHLKWEHPNVDIGICASHIWLGLIDKEYKPIVSIYEENNRVVWKISI